MTRIARGAYSPAARVRTGGNSRLQGVFLGRAVNEHGQHLLFHKPKRMPGRSNALSTIPCRMLVTGPYLFATAATKTRTAVDVAVERESRVRRRLRGRRVAFAVFRHCTLSRPVPLVRQRGTSSSTVSAKRYCRFTELSKPSC